MVREYGKATGDSGDAEALDGGLAPGKRSLTEQLGKMPAGAPSAPGQITLASTLPIARKKKEGAGAQRTPEELQAIVAKAAAGGGAPLPPLLARKFARTLGIDLSAVRVHTDSAAAEAAEAVGARAFASGDQLFFGAGQYNPGSPAGDLLIAHELAHVAQHAAGELGGPGRITEAGDSVEASADAMAAAMVAGKPGPETKAAKATGGAGAVVARNPGAAAKAEAEPTLPPNVNLQIQTDGRVFALTEWLTSDPSFNIVNGETFTPVRNVEILRALKAAGQFSWMEDANIPKYAATVRMQGVIDKKKKVTTLRPAATIYAIIGPAPGQDVSIVDYGNGVLVIMRSTAVVPGGVSAKTTVDWPVALRAQVAAAIEAYTGMPILAGPRTELTSADGYQLTVEPGNNGVLVPFGDKAMEYLYGKQVWTEHLAKQKADPGAGTATAGGVKFTSSIPEADRQYFLDWMKQLGSTTPPTPSKDDPSTITPGVIAMLRDLDKPEKAALKKKVVELLKANGTGATPQQLDVSFLTTVIAAADAANANAELGNKPDPSAKTYKPLFTEPVLGKLINRAGLNYVDQDAEFVFECESNRDAFAIPYIDIKWTAVSVAEPGKHLKDDTSHYSQLDGKPSGFTFKFPQKGTYRIHAFVTHAFYQPAHFQLDCEVKTESERMTEMNAKAFGGLQGGTTFDSGKNAYPFDVSWFNTMFGSQKQEYGTWTEGNTPDGFTRLDYKDRVAFVGKDKKALEEMIKAHTTDHTLNGPAGNPQWADMISYAKDQLKQLDETQKTLDAESKDSTFFEARGSFLSRKNGIADTVLKLVASAKKDGDAVKTTIHDFTQLYEPTNYTFSATGKTFHDAVKGTFTDLCKSYPPGRVSVLFEQLDDSSLTPLKKTVGYELDTGTAWKDVKSVVYNEHVKLAVNIIGAAVMVFVPGSGALLLPALAVYNSVDTLDNMAQLRAKGTLTSMNVATGVAEIGLNFLPYVGELKAVATAGKVARYALEGVTIAGMGTIMTVQAIESIRQIRDGQITEIAKLDGDIRELERTNPSDPKLAGMRADLDAKIKAAQKVSAQVFQQLAESGAIMLVQMAALKAIESNMAAKTVASMKSEGLFHPSEGIEPHYDPKTGTIRGDETKLGKMKPDEIAKLKIAYATDMAAKQAEMANVLGTDKVKITRGGEKITIKPDGEGGYTVEIPTEKPFNEALDEAWKTRKATDPKAPADRPPPVVAEIKPTLDPADILSKQNIAVGTHVKTEGEAQAILGKLAAGDHSAFKALGMEAPPKSFDTRSVEWGIGQLPDGSFILIRGEGGAVNWAGFGGVRPVAHSHPLNDAKLIKGGTTSFPELVKGGGKGGELNKVNVFPSAADVAFCVRNGLGEHTVQTPYVAKGGGKIGNPTPGVHEPQVAIKILQPERVGSWAGNAEIGVYKSKMVATDASGKTLWSGEVYTVDHEAIGSLVMFSEPPEGLMTKGVIGAGATPTTPTQTKAGTIPPADAARVYQSANSHAEREIKKIQLPADGETRVKDAARDAGVKAYTDEMAKPGKKADDAVKVAGDAADKAARATAQAEAVAAAQAEAAAKISSGAVFDLNDPGKADAKAQLAAYGKGTVGGAAKRLSPQLGGKSAADMELVLDAEVTAGNATKTKDPIKDPTDPLGVKTQDQLVYDFTDGTLIRVKPLGDKFNKGQLMYSVEVKTSTPAPGQDGVAFKVDSAGEAVPKGPADVANPYDKGKNKLQWEAFQKAVMAAGHQKAP